MSDKPKWKQFEEAVGVFIQTLGQGVRCQLDVMIPDVDTGHPRQCDAWIEAQVASHYLVRIYVSCKDEARKLTIQDVETCEGERRSRGAHLAILYSASGFSRTAIAKAEKLRIHCCRLYIDAPADIPESLFFFSYCLVPTGSLVLDAIPEELNHLVVWQDLFDVQADVDEVTVLDLISAIAQIMNDEALKTIASTKEFPGTSARVLTLQNEGWSKALAVQVRLRWNVYEGKTEAHLLNGSYCLTGRSFRGRQSGPRIDTRGPDPGPDWDLLTKPPSRLPDSFITALMIPDWRDAFLQSVGPRGLPPLKSR